MVVMLFFCQHQGADRIQIDHRVIEGLRDACSTYAICDERLYGVEYRVDWVGMSGCPFPECVQWMSASTSVAVVARAGKFRRLPCSVVAHAHFGTLSWPCIQYCLRPVLASLRWHRSVPHVQTELKPLRVFLEARLSEHIFCRPRGIQRRSPRHPPSCPSCTQSIPIRVCRHRESSRHAPGRT